MKKILTLLVCLCACAATMQAQKGQSSLGVGLTYGNEAKVGLGVQYRYSFTDNWRIEPSFNYYFKHDYVSFWDLGANVHYLFPVAEQVDIYPLAGLCYFNGKAHLSDWGKGWHNVNSGELAARIGAGADFKIATNITIDVEAKYLIVENASQLMVSAGVNFAF